MYYERNDDCTLGYTYTIGFGLQKHTPLLFCIEFLLKLLYIDLYLLRKLSLLANSSLFIACSSFIIEIIHKTLQISV